MDLEGTIVQMLGEMQASIGRIEGKVNATHEQACKTNGRVTKLEGKVDALESIQDQKAGAKSVKNDIKNKTWELLKTPISALIGGVVGYGFGNLCNLFIEIFKSKG